MTTTTRTKRRKGRKLVIDLERNYERNRGQLLKLASELGSENQITPGEFAFLLHLIALSSPTRLAAATVPLGEIRQRLRMDRRSVHAIGESLDRKQLVIYVKYRGYSLNPLIHILRSKTVSLKLVA